MVTKAKTASASETGPPAASELSSLLGKAHAAFQTLTARGGGATCEWKRYKRESPWVLKVSHGKRTLFYVKPARGSFEVTVLLGARATEAALGGRVSEGLHASIRSARAYAEGRPVRVVVKSKADLVAVEELLAVKLESGTAGCQGRTIAGFGSWSSNCARLLVRWPALVSSAPWPPWLSACCSPHVPPPLRHSCSLKWPLASGRPPPGHLKT